MYGKALWLLLAATTISSCTNDSAQDLQGTVPQEDITYNQHVRTIIDNNCIACHGTTPTNGAPMSLTNFEQVRDAVQNRGLLDRISRAEGTPGLMPNGGPRLPQNLIDIIVQWNTDGLQQ